MAINADNKNKGMTKKLSGIQPENWKCKTNPSKISNHLNNLNNKYQKPGMLKIIKRGIFSNSFFISNYSLFQASIRIITIIIIAIMGTKKWCIFFFYFIILG